MSKPSTPIGPPNIPTKTKPPHGAIEVSKRAEYTPGASGTPTIGHNPASGISHAMHNEGTPEVADRLSLTVKPREVDEGNTLK